MIKQLRFKLRSNEEITNRIYKNYIQKYILYNNVISHKKEKVSKSWKCRRKKQYKVVFVS